MNLLKNVLFSCFVCCWFFASGTTGLKLMKNRVSTFALSLKVKVTTTAPLIKCEFGTIEIDTSKDAKIVDSDIKTWERYAVKYAIERYSLSAAENWAATMIMKEGFDGELTGGAIEEIVVSSSAPVVRRAVFTADLDRRNISNLEADRLLDRQSISNLQADFLLERQDRSAEKLVLTLQDVSSALKLYEKKELDIGTSMVFKELKVMWDDKGHFMGNYRKAGKSGNLVSRGYREEIALRVLKELQKAERTELLELALTAFVMHVNTRSDYHSRADFNMTGAIAVCIDALEDSIRTCAATATDRDEFVKHKPDLVLTLNMFFRPLLIVFGLRSVEELPPV